MANLFTYGSLMYPDIWRTLVKGNYRNLPANLSGFQRCFIRGDSYPVLVPATPFSVLEGRVYLHLAEPDWMRLDRFEGVYYHRKSVQVVTVQNGIERPIRADCYFLKPRFRHLATRRAWHPEHFERHLKAQFLRCAHKRP